MDSKALAEGLSKMRFPSTPPEEKPINEYKYFFKKYLLNVKDYNAALRDTNAALNLLISNPVTSAMQYGLKHYVKIAVQIEDILKTHFTPDLFALYKKKVEKQPSTKLGKMEAAMEKSVFLGIMTALGASFEEMNEEAKRQYEYQKNVLNLVYGCLQFHGLHPMILLRNEQKHKRFNLLIKHKTHSRTPLEDYKVLIPWNAFHSDYLEYYKRKKPIKLGGKLIPFDKIIELKITTTLLKDDELELFAKKNRIVWQPGNKKELQFLNTCNDETERFHPNPFEAEVKAKSPDRYQETKISLIDFPDSLKLFNAAITKINSPSHFRNCLDDLRLCMETLLKAKLNNNKSLENQTAPLGKFLKEKGGSSEINNLFHKLMEFYSKYQNTYVKHNDAVKPNEVKLIVNLSSELIVHIAAI